MRASCEIQGTVALVRMDDGAKNVVSPAMIGDMHRALDQAARSSAKVLVLTGREQVFCAGFDLQVIKGGNPVETLKMLVGGFRLAARLLAFPKPVVIACNGHAVAMGAFLLLTGDYRFWAKGDFRIATNEVAIGLTVPRAGLEICRQRLTPAALTRATLLAEDWYGEAAVEAGFVDQWIEADALLETVLDYANLLALEGAAHAHSKARLRRSTLATLRRAIWRDSLSFVWLGITRVLRPGR